MQFFIGTDPEVFVRNSKTSEFFPGVGLVPGDKKSPHSVELGAVQVDGLALEFNIDPVSGHNSEDEFFHNVSTVYKTLGNMAKATGGEHLVLEASPVAKFSKNVWAGISAESKVLGCDPDYSSLTGDVNPNPGEKLMEMPLRTASGHIHIGWGAGLSGAGHFTDCQAVARYFHEQNVFAPKTNAEKIRLKYYGMDGSFRPKSYGVELRAPSNTWLLSEAGIRNIYNIVSKTFKEFAGV